jgi:hypothetical protein
MPNHVLKNNTRQDLHKDKGTLFCSRCVRPMVVVLGCVGEIGCGTLVSSQNTAISGIPYAGFDGAGGGSHGSLCFFVNEDILQSWAWNAVMKASVSARWRRSLTV